MVYMVLYIGYKIYVICVSLITHNVSNVIKYDFSDVLK